ncbi:MAG TPA: gamma-glutamyl-gamma-aminobutyrate hydrolase family protein, partial [Candidatus Binatia bacterium]|nr:gamma-glutamyl-gamma-aminobutyrate hydrolase family protein [Candidatus Binatia bacterium]
MIRGSFPLIGVTADVASPAPAPSKPFKDTTLFLPQRYVIAIERAGAVPVILSFNRTSSVMNYLLDMLDGILLSGGDFDIHPRYYGEHPLAALGKIKAARTEFELELTAKALKRD